MTRFKIEIKWGMIFAGMILAWISLERVAGFHDSHIAEQPVVTSLILLPAIAIYALALLDVRKARPMGTMTYKQAFASGMILTLVIAVLSPLTQTLSTFVISPAYFDNAIRYAVDKGLMDLDSARKQFNFGSYLIQGFIGALVTGAIMSAVLAVFIKRRSAVIAQAYAART